MLFCPLRIQLMIEFIIYFTKDFLQEILHSNQSDNASIFVDNQSEVDLLILKFFKKMMGQPDQTPPPQQEPQTTGPPQQ